MSGVTKISVFLALVLLASSIETWEKYASPSRAEYSREEAWMNTSCKIDKIRIPLNILKNNISLSFCIFQSILDSFLDF